MGGGFLTFLMQLQTPKERDVPRCQGGEAHFTIWKDEGRISICSAISSASEKWSLPWTLALENELLFRAALSNFPYFSVK